MARRGRPVPQHDPATSLRFTTKVASPGVSSADTVSYRYVVRRAAGGRWELRIYPMDTDSGARVPELFASRSTTCDSRAECIAIAQAFHNLGDSYNEFGHGYHSRFDHALADAATGSPHESARRPTDLLRPSHRAPPRRHRGRPPRPDQRSVRTTQQLGHDAIRETRRRLRAATLPPP